MAATHAISPDHESIVPLSATVEVRERLFPDWDMELVTATDIRDVLMKARHHAIGEQNAASPRVLLEELDPAQSGEWAKS